MFRRTPLRALKDYLRKRYREVSEQPFADLKIARQQRACHESALYIDRFMPLTPLFDERKELLTYVLERCDHSLKGLYCEFGVFQGVSINQIAAHVSPRKVHGFDSFEGLPEDWKPDVSKGHFAIAGLPQVLENVTLHKGWFSDTLPGFLKEHKEPVEFLHIDCDLYSSTKTVFDLFGSQIMAGTVIQFDEFFNYPGWEHCEFLAFQELCEARNAKVEYLGYSRWEGQVAVKILSIDPTPTEPLNLSQ